MTEMERTRVRERERPEMGSYEERLLMDREFAERQMKGQIVVKREEREQVLCRQGLIRNYLGHKNTKTALQEWIVFTHEVRTHSGKHRHQGGLVIYVIEGKGYSVVDGERIEWQKGDLILLPLRPNGVEHQHFNLQPGTPALWMAFIHQPTREYLAAEITQSEVSNEYREKEGRTA